MSARKHEPLRPYDAMDCWISTHEAAVLMGVSKRHVRNLVSRGILPAKRRGHVYHLRVRDVTAHMESLPDAKQAPDQRTDD